MDIKFQLYKMTFNDYLFSCFLNCSSLNIKLLDLNSEENSFSWPIAFHFVYGNIYHSKSSLFNIQMLSNFPFHS